VECTAQKRTSPNSRCRFRVPFFILQLSASPHRNARARTDCATKAHDWRVFHSPLSACPIFLRKCPIDGSALLRHRFGHGLLCHFLKAPSWRRNLTILHVAKLDNAKLAPKISHCFERISRSGASVTNMPSIEFKKSFQSICIISCPVPRNGGAAGDLFPRESC
jgi:hypothetical protein